MQPNTSPLQAEDRIAALEAEVAALRGELAAWVDRYAKTARNTINLMAWTGLISHEVELEAVRASRPSRPVHLCLVDGAGGDR
jgi:hypothetical protein